MLVPVKRGNGGSDAVTAILLVAVKKGIGVSASSYCSTVTTRVERK
jgi:hypothetical protein